MHSLSRLIISQIHLFQIIPLMNNLLFHFPYRDFFYMTKIYYLRSRKLSYFLTVRFAILPLVCWLPWLRLRYDLCFSFVNLPWISFKTQQPQVLYLFCCHTNHYYMDISITEICLETFRWHNYLLLLFLYLPILCRWGRIWCRLTER